MKIDNNLAQVRQQRGYSAAALAKAVAVSRQTIYAIEAGSYIPNTVLSLQLARTLEVTVEELFSLGDGGPRLAPTREMELLPGIESIQPGQPVQLCRVDRRMIGSAPESAARRCRADQRSNQFEKEWAGTGADVSGRRTA